MSNVFEFLNAINHLKVDKFAGNPEAEKDYVPFVINRTLSYCADAVMWANEMNRMGIPNKWQFDFLMISLPKKKRYVKWDKKPPATDDINMVARAYNLSYHKAVAAAELLSPEQLESLRQDSYQGGRTKA